MAYRKKNSPPQQEVIRNTSDKKTQFEILKTGFVDSMYDRYLNTSTDGGFKAVCLSGVRTEDNTGASLDKYDAIERDGFLEITVRPLDPTLSQTLPDPAGSKNLDEFVCSVGCHTSVFTAKSDFKFENTTAPKFGQIINCYFEEGSIRNSNFSGLRFSKVEDKEEFHPDYKSLTTLNAKTTAKNAFQEGAASLLGEDDYEFVGPLPPSDISEEDRILYDLIAKFESAGSYDAVNVVWYPSGKGGGEFEISSDLNATFEGTKISELSFGKIKQLQSTYFTVRYPKTKPANSFFAMGKFQVIPKTMRLVRASMDFSDSDIYSPENQDRIIEFLIYSGKKRKKLSNYLLNKGSTTLDQAQIDLAQEFSSIPKPNGGSWYGNETSRHPSETIRTALKNARDANKKNGRTSY